MGKPRWSDIETICRYKVIENQILQYKETIYNILPLIYFDGNSVELADPNSGEYRNVARPYLYHVKGTQRLKNFAGQTWANGLENMVQHKFKVAKESLPEENDYLDAYSNVQRASTLVYKAFKDNDPNVPVPPPQEIMPAGLPQEVMAAFTTCDQTMQTITGSYDASLGINDNQLSGVAIVEGATQSNAAAMPYIVGHMHGLQQLANGILGIIPKIWPTPVTIPVQDKEGKRAYVKVNSPGGPNIQYDSNALQVKVEANASFTVQKEKALGMIQMLMANNDTMKQFFSTDGLGIVLDNLDIRGADQLKEMVPQFQKKIQQQQQQAMQAQQAQAQGRNQANPFESVKLQQAQQKMMIEAEQKAEQQRIDRERNQIEREEIHADLIKTANDLKIQKSKADTERYVKHAELALHEHDMHHRHIMDVHDRVHNENEREEI